MRILMLTPHKGEMDDYYLQQQVEMIKNLKEEIPIRNEEFVVDLIPFHQIDFNKSTLEELYAFLDKNKKMLENADIIHSFSEIPLHFSAYFKKTKILTLNLEKNYEQIKHLLPKPDTPGFEVTTNIKYNPSIPFQEILPGFLIDTPKKEFSLESNNVAIFANSMKFVEEAKKNILKSFPNAQFFIKTREGNFQPKKEDKIFNTTMVDSVSFKFCVSEPSKEKEIDMLPLKMVSKGIPVFLLNSPLEKKFYPEFLAINSFDELKPQFDKIVSTFKTEKLIKDELHSFSCRNFFFSKMIDDVIRLYNNVFNNNKAFDKRPWGYWESLLISEQYKVKHFFVENNEQLSLQSHRYRDEIWMVVKGNGVVTIDGERTDASKGDIFIIKRGQKHTVKGTNSGLDIVEIQTGDYLGEDDIFRFEDKYGRK